MRKAAIKKLERCKGALGHLNVIVTSDHLQTCHEAFYCTLHPSSACQVCAESTIPADLCVSNLLMLCAFVSVTC